MTDCILTTSPPYYCTVCGFGKDRDFTEPFHYRCKGTKEEQAQVQLDRLAKNSTSDNTDTHRTLEEIKANLDICVACPDEQFTGTGCRLYGGCDGQEIWVLSHQRTNRGCKNKHWGPSRVATATP